MIFDRKINRLKVVITAVLILLAALFAYIFNDVFEYAEEQLTDFRSSLSTDKGLFSEKFSEASDNIIIISVNDLTRYSAARSSELNLAHWPWSRAVWAEFINFIEKQEPQMVIIDMNFSNYEDIALNRYSPDMIFANTLSNYDNIILATALRTPYVSTNNVVPASILDNFDNPFSPVKESLAVHIDNPEMVNKISYFSHTPIPDIFTQSTTMAVTNLPLSKKTDNIRYSQPVYKLIKGNREYYIPSIGLAALLKYTGSVDEIIIKDNVLRTGNHSIQLNDNGQALINWHGQNGTYLDIPINSLMLSMVRGENSFVFSGEKYPLSILKDKIILITQTQMSTETHDTPVDKEMTDAEIKATIIDNYINDSNTKKLNKRRFAKHLSMPKTVCLTCAFCAAIIFAITIATNLLLAFTNGLFIILIYCGLSILIFCHPRYHILLYMAVPLYCMGVTFLMAYVLKVHHEYKKRKRIEKIFGNLVSEDVLKQIMNKPHRLNLKSSMQKVTVMSCDIYNNVQVSDTVTPENYVNIINNAFGIIERIIFKYNGTINRFVGNSVLVYWGYPIHSRKDTENALKAAVEIEDEIRKFSEELREKMDEEDDKQNADLYLKVKIALNTGNAIIGQLGSKSQSELTLLGETVDVIERIETICTEFDKNIVLTESVLENLDVPPAVDYAGVIRLKNSEEKIKLYELKGKSDDKP